MQEKNLELQPILFKNRQFSGIRKRENKFSTKRPEIEDPWILNSKFDIGGKLKHSAFSLVQNKEASDSP